MDMNSIIYFFAYLLRFLKGSGYRSASRPSFFRNYSSTACHM